MQQLDVHDGNPMPKFACISRTQGESDSALDLLWKKKQAELTQA